MRIKLIAFLALLSLVFGLCGSAWAAERPDPERPASLTFVMEFDGEPLEGGSLTLYRVGGIGPDGDRFLLVEPLLADGPALEDLQDPALAAQLNDLAHSRGLVPLTVAIAGGRARFEGLEPGLYVVCQQPGEEIPGYAAIDPFLISLPQWKDGAYVYDLTAAPKVPLIPASPGPTPPPDEPDDPSDLPQTGQLNWPIPLMAVGGLALFALGWNLFFGGKRRRV